MSSNDPRSQPSVPLPGRPERGHDQQRGDQDAQSILPSDGQPPSSGRARANTSTPRDRGSAGVWAALAVGLIIGVLAMRVITALDDGGDSFGGKIDETRYQAVILSNDKVYFGRISSASDSFFALDDAYFLRESRQSEDAEPVRALLPVNSELHGPENRMLIRKDEVVLVENLAEDSPVLREIQRQADGDDSSATTSDDDEDEAEDEDGTTTEPSTSTTRR